MHEHVRLADGSALDAYGGPTSRGLDTPRTLMTESACALALTAPASRERVAPMRFSSARRRHSRRRDRALLAPRTDGKDRGQDPPRCVNAVPSNTEIPQTDTMPRRIARRTASVRFTAPSFPEIAAT